MKLNQSKKNKKLMKSLTKEQAERGIYIDFEGFKNEAPTVIGILIDDYFEQIIFDEKLRLAAEKKDLRVATLSDTVKYLINCCDDEGRKIIAYSNHELHKIFKYADIDISSYYKNARSIAKRWFNREHYEKKLPSWGLKDFLDFIGYNRPSHLGNQKSTSRIKHVKEMIEKRDAYDELTSTAKGKWTKLLHHNRIDCEGMKDLMLEVTKED